MKHAPQHPAAWVTRRTQAKSKPNPRINNPIQINQLHCVKPAEIDDFRQNEISFGFLRLMPLKTSKGDQENPKETPGTQAPNRQSSCRAGGCFLSNDVSPKSLPHGRGAVRSFAVRSEPRPSMRFQLLRVTEPRPSMRFQLVCD